MRANVALRAILSLGALAVAALFLYPFFWMALAAFKTNREIFDTAIFFPGHWRDEGFAQLLANERFNFWQASANSLLLAGLQALGATAFAAGAGFTLGARRFRAAAALRLAGIASILIPIQALALPMFVWMHRIGLFDSVMGLALAGMANGIGLLYFERVFRQTPAELIELARLEGASDFQTFRHLLPLIRPHAIAFGFIVFALSWQAGLLPTLLLHSDDKRTLIMWLAAEFGSGSRPPLAALMAGSTLILLTIGCVFAAAFPFMRTALRDFLR